MNQRQSVQTPVIINTASHHAQHPRRKQRRWRMYVLLLVLLMEVGLVLRPLAEPLIFAAADPIQQAVISAKQVREAEQALAVRLSEIHVAFENEHFNKLKSLDDSVTDFKSCSQELRLIGTWLLQERPRVEADFDRYINKMQAALPRLAEAEAVYHEFADEHPDASEFRAHYLKMADTCKATTAAVKVRIQNTQNMIVDFDKEMAYVANVLLLLDRLDLYLQVVSLNQSDEARRIEQFLTTLSSFRKHFQEMMQLMGQLHGNLNPPVTAEFEAAVIAK